MLLFNRYVCLREEQQQDIQCKITPAYMHCNTDNDNIKTVPSVFAFSDEVETNTIKPTVSTTYTSDDFKSLAQYTMTDAEYNQGLLNCNEEQQHVLQFIENRVVNKTDNLLRLFITGGAGSGKPFLLKLVREHLLRQNVSSYPNIIVAVPTGVAAYSIKAWTLHQLLNIDVQHRNKAEYHPLSHCTLEKLRTPFCNVTVLIIDEVSMVSINTFLHIHKRLSEIKDTCSDPDSYFGNLHNNVRGSVSAKTSIWWFHFFRTC